MGSEAGRTRLRVLVAGLLLMAGACESGDDDHDAGGQTRATTTTAEETTTTVPETTTTTAPPWIDAQSPAGGFNIQIPPRWSYMAVDGDVTGIGQTVAPDDPATAQKIETYAAQLAANDQVKFVALSVDSFQRSGIPEFLRVESENGHGDLPAEQVFGIFEDTLAGATIQEQGTLETPAGPAAWWEVVNPAGVGTHLYVVKGHDGRVWMFTYWTRDLAETRAIADQIFASFTPIPIEEA